MPLDGPNGRSIEPPHVWATDILVNTAPVEGLGPDTTHAGNAHNEAAPWTQRRSQTEADGMQANRLRRTAGTGEKPNPVEQLDLYRLVVFHTVVNEGTMSRASERLFITQPAISAHIKALESGLGVSLFNRVGRRSVVNSAGRLLYAKAEQLLSVADDLKSEMEDLRGIAIGRLNLGASVVWQYHLPNALDVFKQDYPRVELSIGIANSDLIEKMVLDRSVDIGFVARGSARTELLSKSLAKDEVVPICSPAHPLATTSDASPRDLNDAFFIAREPGSATRQITDELLNGLGLADNISMELGSQEAIKQVVMGGNQGIGMVSRAGLTAELRAGLLAIADVAELKAPLNLHVIYHKQKKLTFTQRDFLERIAPDQSPHGRGRLRLITLDANGNPVERSVEDPWREAGLTKGRRRRA